MATGYSPIIPDVTLAAQRRDGTKVSCLLRRQLKAREYCTRNSYRLLERGMPQVTSTAGEFLVKLQVPIG